tara:strand:+ start:302 stop:565 length:264 start_codon:yes stop_codon:yes gene_type:complete
MKNTNRKDFHTRVEVGTVVTISYRGEVITFKNQDECNRKSLWEMCEYLMGEDLQSFWEGQLDLSEKNWHLETREEKRLMNLCKIKFH